MNRSYLYTLLFNILTVLTLTGYPAVAQDIADCTAIKSLQKRDAMTASPRDVRNCQVRGEDPPMGWRYNQGVNSGTKVGGGGGFSYSAISSPEAAPSGANRMARNENRVASVSSSTMMSACTLPPRTLTELGSCARFIAGEIVGAPGRPVVATPIPTYAPCPPETDTSGAYGLRVPIASGYLMCGAMVPTDTRRVVLNRNPTHVAVVDNGLYRIRVYARQAGQFRLVQNMALPTYLCELRWSEAGVWEKSMDLTAPLGQIMTYSGNGSLAIRLRSRERMPAHYRPPYDPMEPERFLRVPYSNGTLQAFPECPDEDYYAQTYAQLAATGLREEVLIEPDVPPECELTHVNPTAFNDYIITRCPAGAVIDTEVMVCRQTTASDDGSTAPPGAVVPPLEATDNWVMVCPDAPGETSLPRTTVRPLPPCMQANGTPIPTDSVNVPPCRGLPITETNTCPQSPGIPGATAACPGGGAPVNGVCPGMNAGDPALGGAMDMTPCGTRTLCDMVNLPTTRPACATQPYTPASVQRIQYGVLNRPGIHYPEDSTATILPLSGASLGSPTAMAITNPNTRYFTLPQTAFQMQRTAADINFNEGGTITLADRSILIMSPNATFHASTGRITMYGGGQRVSPGGEQLASFAEGAVYAPGNLLRYPVLVRVSRSATLAAGHAIPTMPNNALPHMRLPADPLPQQ